ncbi:hypothetical protein DY000_02059356 [Brassica cretica]|uniref:Reverse transcriptase zinc-binding domain-containing protein n=1 Tax=Brassica cretica TaxID=69181 RepID=A0ABQ7AVL9_BRACR|nr:hypothetical protein DY000_02059356 [Brassica cretica]
MKKNLVVADLLTHGSHDWNQARVELIFPEVAHLILQIKPSSLNAEDAFCWQRARNGIYSVKTGYYAALDSTDHPTIASPAPDNFTWNRHVWDINTSEKLKLFLWKLCRGALALGANLQQRGMALQAVCPHCNATESALHLFFTCPFAQQVWRLAPFATPVDWLDINTPHQALIRATSLLNLPPTGLTSDLVSWILWGIWKARNLLSFEHKATTAPAVMTSAISGAREWSMAQQTNLPRTSTTRYMERPPTLPTVRLTCNSDAAWRKETNNAGLGWVIIGSQDGLIYEGQGHARFVSSPLMAEALAVKGMLLAASHLTTTNFLMQQIPESLVARMLNLWALDLHSNQLKTFPNSIGCLSKLKVLNVSGNNLQYLPKNYRRLQIAGRAERQFQPTDHASGHDRVRANEYDEALSSYSVGLLISLVELDVSYNGITVLPDSIACLRLIQKLSVEGNPLVSPPFEVVEQGLESVKQYMSEKMTVL